jgi:hypothetical protein
MTRSQVTFSVKNYVSGKPRIAIEELVGDLNVKGLLGLDPKDGTTLDQAKEIAQYLNAHIGFVTLT